MKIKKLNSLYLLIEGLDVNFDFAQADIDAQNAGEIEGKSKKFQKQIAKGKKTSEGETLKKIQSIIEKWDSQGLTKNFRSTLISRFAKEGLNSRDVVIQWLTQTKDANIKALDVGSATTLFKLLDEKDLVPNDPYIIEDNNLFTESSKDISYKLNVLNIISDPSKADKYKNPQGYSPNIKLIYKDGKFLTANEMRKNLDGFVSNNKDNEIPLSQWIRVKSNVREGEELDILVKTWQKTLAHVIDAPNEDIPSRIILAIQPNIDGKNNKLYSQELAQNILNFNIPSKTTSWQNVFNLLVDGYKKNKLTSKDINTTISTALLTYLAARWSKNLNNYANLVHVLKEILFKNSSDQEKEKYIPKLEIFKSNDARAIYLGTGLKDNKLSTIENATKIFLDKYSN